MVAMIKAQAKTKLKAKASNMLTADTITKATSNWSVEITVGMAGRTEDFKRILPPATHVSITFLQGEDGYSTVEVGKRLLADGMHPAPHISARLLTSHDHLTGITQALRDAKIDEVVIIAGGAKIPLGPFTSTQDVLDSGILQKAGVRRIGVAGYPEGNPYVRDPKLTEALAWKNEFAQREGLEVYIATQFCFDGDKIVAWEKAIRQAGNRLPIRVGIAGPATIKTLFRFAQITGVGPSVRFIATHASQDDKLTMIDTPHRVIAAVSQAMHADKETKFAGFHYYPFGGLERTAEWAGQVAAGKITLAKAGGFSVTNVTHEK